MDTNGKNKVEMILKWIVLVILAVVAMKIVFSVFALAWVLGGILLTKVLPLVLLVWGVLKLVEWWKSRNGGTAASPAESEF
ncbi:hypothetical protein [Longimicrobium sp.]|uniref:hypothetical protein n=1 Tax=Longimicrobium sp. TaxID=2029185 RepID=UPI002C24082D|nr:hypothetical protein [Longimicrobium sp.]HSU12876.1 hypothetical protein [Longimicrobium sp.]